MRVACTALALSGVVVLCPIVVLAQPALTLADVLARARAQAPQVVSARLAIDEARGRLLGASLRLQSNPEVDVSLGNRQGAGTRSTDLQLGATQMFEPPGRRTARIAGATAQIEQGVATAEETTRVALRDAAMTFYQAVYAAEQVRLLTDSVDLANAIYQTADRRFRAGDLAVSTSTSHARRWRGRGRNWKQARPSKPPRWERCAPCFAWTVRSPSKAAWLSATLPLSLRLLSPWSSVRSSARSRRPSAKPTPRSRWRRRCRNEITALGSATRRKATITSCSAGSRSRCRPSRRGRSSRRRARHAARDCGPSWTPHGHGRASSLQTALDAHERRVVAARVLEAEALPGLDENDALTTRSFDAGQIGLPDVLLIRRELLETRSQYLSTLLEAALARVNVDAAAAVLR
jgi:cobalt-zinc-cadmium efflux system outer membrane protein